MERELWQSLYWMIRTLDKCISIVGQWYSDGVIACVYLWAAVHDRPTVWACDERNWPRDEPLPPFAIPSQPTMSRRLRTPSVIALLQHVHRMFLESSSSLQLVKMIDGKPLPVGGHSTDRNARWGRAVRGTAKGYKLYAIWAAGDAVPIAWDVRSMNVPETTVARQHLIPHLAEHPSGDGGYLLGDGIYDSNPLYDAAQAANHQLVAPRDHPGTKPGHRRHSPARLRSIELLEGGGAYGQALEHARDQIERLLGNLTSFGGGLAPLPAWVRRPWRVRLWVQAKLLINAARIIRRRHGLDAAA